MKCFILDVDGVLTTGQFLYTKEGNVMKIFGPDDADGLSLLSPYIGIRFVTGDRKGFGISHKRIVEDMKYPLDLVSPVKRIEWIQDLYDLKQVIYMGDGIFDQYVMKQVGYAIAPVNADKTAKESANFVTKRADYGCKLNDIKYWGTPYDPANPYKEYDINSGFIIPVTNGKPRGFTTILQSLKMNYIEDIYRPFGNPDSTFIDNILFNDEEYIDISGEYEVENRNDISNIDISYNLHAHKQTTCES